MSMPAFTKSYSFNDRPSWFAKSFCFSMAAPAAPIANLVTNRLKPCPLAIPLSGIPAARVKTSASSLLALWPNKGLAAVEVIDLEAVPISPAIVPKDFANLAEERMPPVANDVAASNDIIPAISAVCAQNAWFPPLAS